MWYDKLTYVWYLLYNVINTIDEKGRSIIWAYDSCVIRNNRVHAVYNDICDLFYERVHVYNRYWILHLKCFRSLSVPWYANGFKVISNSSWRITSAGVSNIAYFNIWIQTVETGRYFIWVWNWLPIDVFCCFFAAILLV